MALNDFQETQVSAIRAIESRTEADTIASLFKQLQEIEEVLHPGRQVKKRIREMSEKIQNLALADLAWVESEIIMDRGGWESQTLRAFEIACIYAAMLAPEQSNIEAPMPMAALHKAAYFSGLAAGFSHHRKITAIEKARKAGLAKASRKREVAQTTIVMLATERPRNGWQSTHSAAVALSPLMKTVMREKFSGDFSTSSLQAAINNAIADDPTVRSAYLKNANKRQN